MRTGLATDMKARSTLPAEAVLRVRTRLADKRTSNTRLILQKTIATAIKRRYILWGYSSCIAPRFGSAYKDNVAVPTLIHGRAA